MPTEVDQVKGRKIQPSLTPGRGEAESKHPNAPVRLRADRNVKSNRTIKDRSNRSM